MSRFRWMAVIPIAGIALTCPACSSAGPKLHPVRGSVLFNDQPADGATVVLDPVGAVEGTAKPSGVVRADGTFSVQTYPHGDGAPAGEYAVLITWFPPDARESGTAKNRLPAKY